MNLTAKLTPYSSVVGGGLKLVDENGRACFVVAIMGTTDGISKEQNDELAKRLADGFNTPQPDAAPADATAWLIEFSEKVSRTPAYYGHTDEGLGETTDSLKAVRFARREDAQAIIDDIGWNEARPVEHMWADSKCCNDLSPEECAQVPDRHCDGLQPASPLPADDVVEAAIVVVKNRMQPGIFSANSIVDALAAANLLRQSAPVEANTGFITIPKAPTKRMIEEGAKRLLGFYGKEFQESQDREDRLAFQQAKTDVARVWLTMVAEAVPNYWIAATASPPADAAGMREKIARIVINDAAFDFADTAHDGEVLSDLRKLGLQKADAILALLPTDAAVKALVEALANLTRDCTASDFNEHWDSFKNAEATLAANGVK